MSKYTLRASSRGAWRVNWSAEALGLGGAARGEGGDGEAADAAPPTPEERAAAAVGLDAAFPSRAERRAFPELLGRRRGVQTYLSVRNKLLLAWEADVSKLLSAKGAAALVPSSQAALARDVQAFLHREGIINFGLAVTLKKPIAAPQPQPAPLPRAVALPPAAAAAGAGASGAAGVAGDAGCADAAAARDGGGVGSEATTANPSGDVEGIAAAAPPSVPDDVVVAAVASLLLQVDLTTTTERQIRRTLEAQLGCDLADRKALIREQVTSFLASAEARETVAAAPTQLAGTPFACDPRCIVVIGAGPAGLAAARHLAANGMAPLLLEARGRVGGRVWTDAASLSVPIDVGASIITGITTDDAKPTRLGRGVRADPTALVVQQLQLKMHVLHDKLPLHDTATGARVPAALDAAVEELRDSLMDAARERVDKEGEDACASIPLGVELERQLAAREAAAAAAVARAAAVAAAEADSFLSLPSDDVAPPAPAPEAVAPEAVAPADAEGPAAVAEETAADGVAATTTEAAAPAAPAVSPAAAPPPPPTPLSDTERRLLDWHWANLEYGCSAQLHEVSLAHWNQDEEFGGFGGDHAMIPGGYQQVTAALSSGLDIRLSSPVSHVEYAPHGVRVHLANGRGCYTAAACVLTAPLGVLKAGDIGFDPQLPPRKAAAIRSLGFGCLNKLFLEFEHAFWDTGVDYFGAALPGGAEGRGRCFMFWNLVAVAGAPVLACLHAGAAAAAAEAESDEALASHAMIVLRSLFPGAPNPIGACASRWGSDPYARGSYSFVACGASGEDYKALAAPLAGGRLTFAGEHCCREHPDTVGGAMLTGIRAANTVLASLASRDAAAEWAEDALEWDQGPLPLPDDGGDSDSDATSGSDSEGGAHPAADGRGRVRRRGDKAERVAAEAAPVLPWTQRLGELDAALEARRRFYLRLAAADGAGLAALMASAPDAPARRGLLRHLLGLPPPLLRDWGVAHGGLAHLATWVRHAAASASAPRGKGDADEARVASGAHLTPGNAVTILELALRVLGRVQASLAELAPSGLLPLLKAPALAAAADPGVRSLVASLSAKYAQQRRTGRTGAGFGTGGGSGGESAAAAAAGIAAARAGGANPARAVPRVTLDNEDEALSAAAARMAAARAAAAQAAAAPAYWRPREAEPFALSGAAPGGAGYGGDDAASLAELPAEAAAKLAEAAAKLAETAAAARAAEAELGAACAALAGPPVLSFDKFALRERKRARREAKKAARAAADTAAEATGGDGGEPAYAADPEASAPDAQGGGGLGAPGLPDDDAPVGDLSPRSSRKLRAGVAAYVHGLLKPAYAARQLSREAFKELAVKCTQKVLDGTQLTGGAGEAGAGAFLTGHRKRKVAALVAAAVDKVVRRNGGNGVGEEGHRSHKHGHKHGHKSHKHSKHGRDRDGGDGDAKRFKPLPESDDM